MQQAYICTAFPAAVVVYGTMLRTYIPFRQAAFALLCAVWMVSCCCAQDLRYLSHQAWSTEEGLPQSSVHSVLQTQDGYVWVATEGGLARFDGWSFTVFDRKTEPAFHSEDLCCLLEAERG